MSKKKSESQISILATISEEFAAPNQGESKKIESVHKTKDASILNEPFEEEKLEGCEKILEGF